MSQDKWFAKLKKERDEQCRKLSEPFLGTYKTFKEARKNAREIARLTYRYGQIKVVNDAKKETQYIVTLEDDFDFYVHRDGRVCKIENLQKEQKKWNRHPEQMKYAHPFVYRVENRGREEGKEEYKKRMAIQNKCNL